MYEYYHSCPPPVVAAFEKLLVDALGMRVSLTEYREALGMLQKEEEEFQAYR